MKRKITIITTLVILNLFQNLSLKAQMVTIPDAHFVTFLQTNFPGCMTGNQMDTTCAGITSAITLDVSNLTITDLTGVQYFHNLNSLLCSHNLLTSLPPLPINLNTLGCDQNQLTSLPTLPPNLTILSCYANQLTTLPALPGYLVALSCSSNQLTSLPTLPNSLIDLDYSTNQIPNVPPLPTGLQSLVCDATLMTSLLSLPPTLNSLSCDYNFLTSLPALPNTLIQLQCAYNQISNLPTLPSGLQELWCYNNQISSLQTLPNTLSVLVCDSNQISCFPVFPHSLDNAVYFSLTGNPFHCLPNYIPVMDSTTLTFPLCIAGDTINNPNHCPVAQGIIGYTYKDIDSNCVYGTSDFTSQNIPVKLYDSGNNLIEQTISGINGVYDFTEAAGTYTVKIDTTGMPFSIQCINPGIDSTVILTTANPLQTRVNFAVSCKPGFDVGVRSITESGMVFPGQNHTLRFIAGDMSNWYNLHCASGISGQVVITVTGPVSVYDVTPNAIYPSIAGNVFTYPISDFSTGNILTDFGLIFTTDVSAQFGDSICVNVVVTPTTGDNDISNNTFNYCYLVSNSYDPNYKETTPTQVQPAYNDYFYYTIHFQNTGTAAAINIQLQDTLDANLDLNTFQVINSSHYNTVMLTGNKLSFNFPNIQLPDSTNDFNGSQGFVQYRIKPISNLPGGTMIHNKASIYFDYNAAVVTNTTTNEFMLATATSNIQHPTSLSVYPNPSTGKYSIKLSDGTDVTKLTVEVTNILGEIVLESKIQHTASIIDLSNQPAGVYFVRIIGGEQSLNQRVVKQ